MIGLGASSGDSPWAYHAPMEILPLQTRWTERDGEELTRVVPYLDLLYFLLEGCKYYGMINIWCFLSFPARPHRVMPGLPLLFRRFTNERSRFTLHSPPRTEGQEEIFKRKFSSGPESEGKPERKTWQVAGKQTDHIR